MLKKFFLIDKNLFTLKTPAGKLNLFALLFPALFESIMNRLQGTVNTAVLSNYSEKALASVGAANTIISNIVLLGSVVSIGATVLISNSIGADNRKKTQELTFTSIIVIAVTAAFMTPILVGMSNRIMQMLNLKGELLGYATSYFRIRMLFLTVNMVNSVMLAILRCYGFPKYTFIVGLITNILNLILNIYVIYFPEYAPITDIEGVACSPGISDIVGLGIIFCIMKKKQIRVNIPETFKSFLGYAKRILCIGIPAGISNMAFSFSQIVTTSFVAFLGDYALSAMVYYSNILSYVYLFSVSAGNANAIMVGRCYGAKDYERAEKMNIQLAKITRCVNLSISLFVVIFSRHLLGIFTDDEIIFKLAIGIFAVDIITEQARATSQVYEYALRAVGDILFSTIILIISCFVFSIGLAYFLAIECGLGLLGCFIGVAADESVRAIVTYLRWKSGKWKTTLNAKE